VPIRDDPSASGKVRALGSRGVGIDTRENVLEASKPVGNPGGHDGGDAKRFVDAAESPLEAGAHPVG